MNNRTKIYTRLDVQGNKIAGSSVQRKSMPKVGRWVEETLNECCFPYTEISDTPNAVNQDVYTVIIDCSDSAVLTVVLTLDAVTTVIDEVTAALNANMNYLGTFTDDGTIITLKLKQAIADSLCADAANLGLTITGS